MICCQDVNIELCSYCSEKDPRHCSYNSWVEWLTRNNIVDIAKIYNDRVKYNAHNTAQIDRRADARPDWQYWAARQINWNYWFLKALNNFDPKLIGNIQKLMILI
jgi:hypothetical protein